MGLAIAGAQYRWPNRTIAYVVDSDLGCEAEAAAAVAHWNANTSLRFVPRTNEPDFVRIQRLPGRALSDVGRQGGEQKVALGDSCAVGTIIHELGHAVGLWHEQCRQDRDEWVEVDWSNVQDGCEDNFKQDSICGKVVATEDVGPYDYGSIMHYGERSFAIDRRDPVLRLLQPVPPGVVVGQRDGLSPGDIAAVEEMYRGIPAAAPPVSASVPPAA